MRKSGNNDTAIFWVIAAFGLFTTCHTVIFGDGGITPDSVAYLQAAESLKVGNGFRVPNSGVGVARLEPFVVWPVGYPALIGTISWLTGIQSLWVSKLIGMSCLVGCMYAIRAMFPSAFPAAVLLVLSFGPVKLFPRTWSEPPFILGLLLLAAITVRVVERPRDTLDYRVAVIGILCVALFLVRYVGAFSLSVIGALFLWDLYHRRFRRSAQLAVVGIGAVSVMILYLYHNFMVSGFLTGARSAALETPIEMLAHLALKSVQQFVPLLIIPVLWGWAKRTNREVSLSTRAIDTGSIVYFGIGFVYIFAIVTLRWNVAADPLNSRLLVPGTLMVMAAVVHVFMQSSGFMRRGVTIYLTVLAVSAGLWFVLRGDEPLRPHFIELLERRSDRFDAVPPGALVVTQDFRASMYVPHAFVSFPERGQPWDDYISSLDTDGRSVFVDVAARRDLHKDIPAIDAYHATVQAFMTQHTTGTIVQIK